ncbi:MAG: acyl carrier protein [Lachnospiraceae bacterium]|nr:acyl carrier protein [Lachnospiraceae bacterium]
MYEEILQGIIAYWKKEINDESVQVLPESNLMDDLSLSSMEMLRALLVLESKYGINIPEKCLRKMMTIQDVASVITEIVQKKLAVIESADHKG